MPPAPSRREANDVSPPTIARMVAVSLARAARAVAAVGALTTAAITEAAGDEPIV